MTEPGRQTTVLFADVSGSTKLYETAGDAAAHAAIDGLLARLRAVTEAFGGRVVKTIGDELMTLFPSPDAGAGAAAEMQGGCEALPAVAGQKLGLRIGLQAGPVLQKDGDVFGDTVNLASRLVEQAVKGQIVTSEQTAAQLGPVFRRWVRQLYAIPVKGKSDEVMLCEIVWNAQADVTALARTTPQPRPKLARAVLRLVYRGKEVIRRRDADSIVLGREESCGLPVQDAKASRQHCTIERRGDKFVLKDHSTNGTYVTMEGDSEVLLQREELALRRHGWIALGLPRAHTQEVVEYFCE